MAFDLLKVIKDDDYWDWESGFSSLTANEENKIERIEKLLQNLQFLNENDMKVIEFLGKKGVENYTYKRHLED